MKVDLNRKFRGFDGNELGGDNIATAVAEALSNYGKDNPVGRDDKFNGQKEFHCHLTFVIPRFHQSCCPASGTN